MGGLPRVVYADGADGPLPDPSTIATIAALGEVEILLGWVVRTPAWLATHSGPVRTWMAGYGLNQAVKSGRVHAVPTRLSSVPGLLAGRSRPSVAVVGGRRAGRRFCIAGDVGWAPLAAAAADAVVVELWPDAPEVDTPPVPGRIVEVVERSDPPCPAPVRHHDHIDRRIGALAASLIPEGSTVQWGPGAVCAAVVNAIDVPVRVLSGLVGDELVGLHARRLVVGVAEAAYTWGGLPLQALARGGALRLRPVSETHSPSRLSAIEGLVACNTALQVGLDGAVNVESVGGRAVAGPGGHSDFAEAASRSPGGRSIIALRSSYGGRSSIVILPEAVTTPRTDVGFVVTEHGVADLRDLDPRQRARRLVAVAAPEHRDELNAAAGL